MAARNRVGYNRIEEGWRAGLMSPRQLAAIYTHGTGEKVSHAATIKHFTAQSILRDLSAKSKVKSDSMVTAKVTQKTKPPSAGCHSGCQHSALFGRCALGRQHLL